ncbi:TIGR03364 family FAD-dependent oxidoreductase [Oerskovia jenensis]|uniref:TIGR03364 family FAD-dependent oxidoreductase n=1 Tax=Oerskovia jenensis TaxID=162169 RepID=UPI0036DE6EFE
MSSTPSPPRATSTGAAGPRTAGPGAASRTGGTPSITPSGRPTRHPGTTGRTGPDLPARVDLVVVGAGIVGLAHAVEAVGRGLSVLVVERDDRAVGASVRNFGHGCFTAQDGTALTYAFAARERWIQLAKEADFWLRESGTVVVARADDERQVLEDFAHGRDGHVRLLDRDQVLDRVPSDPDEVVGGAFLSQDVRVDPREAVPAIARWYAEQRGAHLAWSTTVQGFEAGSGVTLVRTSRGDVVATRVILAVGHDVDRFFPDTAAAAGVRRCTLQMLRVDAPAGAAGGPREIDPAIFTGTSLLRYDGFRHSPALAAVRERLTAQHPALIDAAVNLMVTQRPDGTLTLGDTHAYATTPGPFHPEALDELLLTEAARLFGAGPLTVRERWQGVYASAPAPFLDVTPMPGVRAVSVTSGIGMTTALGLAPRVLDSFL